MAKKSSEHSWWCCCSGSYFWGIFLIIIGGYFLAVNLGLISRNFPFWPLVFILFGIYLLVKYPRK